ncbi:MAG: penicillin-binding protein 2, partial [Paracoccaceae bacterium]
ALDGDEIERARRELNRLSPFVPVTIADRLEWNDIAAVAVNAPALPGVTPEVGLSRRYPLIEDFAHVVGYVGPVSDYDLERLEDTDPLLQIPKFQIGKIGVETRLEQHLRGKAGTRRIEVNAVGRVIRELDRVEGEPGANIQLTVNAELQNYVQARIAHESAAAVVMDVHNGDLLAVGSTPSYDPNKFVRGISVADYRELTENIYRPLANKAVQGTYPPGSTFKMMTALAGLESGVITAEDTFYCPGHTELGGRRFHCWRRGGHGAVNLHDSLKHSCDVYYYELAQRVGIDNISAMARRFGMGERFDIEMSGIASGLTPTRAWKRERRGEDWVIGDSLNASIGQGFVLASPLQLAVMTARIATGQMVMPRLVRSIDGIEQIPPEAPSMDLNPAYLRAVQRGMYAVSNDMRGTAYSSHIAEETMRMAGKTGTSQVRSAVVNNANVPWEQRDHALFVAYAPYEAPRVAVSVVVEHGGGGSSVAAPIARDIILQTLYDGTPPLSAYPANQRGTIRERQNTLPLRAFDVVPEGRDHA